MAVESGTDCAAGDAVIGLLFQLLVGHAVADFALQSDAMARGKNRHSPILNVPAGQKPTVHWQYWMGSHGLIHAGAVYLVTGSILWAFVELVGHITADILKCENLTTIHTDQAIHVGMKVLYAVVLCRGWL